MSTELECSLDLIISEKSKKIIPQNIKEGISIFDVTGNLEELKGQTKTITPSTEAQSITPDDGYNGLTQVDVSAVDSSIDSNILPENIKKDVNILGVTGNYEGEYNAKIENCGNQYLYQYITSISQIDTSNVTDMTYMFFNFSNLIEIPQMDTSNVTTMERAFSGCKNLVTIPQLDTRNLSNSPYALYSAFNGCDNLSDESLNNILAMCINATNMSTKTLAYMGLTFAQATTCTTLSNYEAFTAAGWTTGYQGVQ